MPSLLEEWDIFEEDSFIAYDICCDVMSRDKKSASASNKHTRSSFIVSCY